MCCLQSHLPPDCFVIDTWASRVWLLQSSMTFCGIPLGKPSSSRRKCALPVSPKATALLYWLLAPAPRPGAKSLTPRVPRFALAILDGTIANMAAAARIAWICIVDGRLVKIRMIELLDCCDMEFNGIRVPFYIRSIPRHLPPHIDPAWNCPEDLEYSSVPRWVQISRDPIDTYWGRLAPAWGVVSTPTDETHKTVYRQPLYTSIYV